MQNLVTASRREILDTLIKRTTDFKDGYRQNIAILGDESIGKTALLNTLLKDWKEEGLVPIYVEIAPCEFALFVKRTLNSLFYNFLKKNRLVSSRENLPLLLKMARDLAPDSAGLAEALIAGLDKEKPEALFKDLFGVIERFSAETKKQCIVIFDEFHNIKHLDLKNICQELGKKIMFQKNALFIFASSAKNEAKDILINDLSLLFGNFEMIELGALDTPSSQSLVRHILDTILIPDDLMRFLIHFTGGHPFYLKAICQEAKLLCQASGRASLVKSSIAETLERVLFDEWGIFHLKFTATLTSMAQGKNKNVLIYLLDAIANGHNKAKDLCARFRQPRAEITQRLNRLVESGILAKDGSFYLISDRLMAFWLKYVHAEKQASLTPDFNEQAVHFRKKIETEIDGFITASRVGFADRMIELFNRFEGDDIQIDRKRFQLDTFKEVKIVHFDSARLKLGLFGKSSDNLWLAALKEDGIQEQDINEFIQGCQKFGPQKTIQKIIIGLGDIERNARLLAKESHIMTWDIAHINHLFDLYGKPRIIR